MKKISKIDFELQTDAIKDHRYASIDDWFNPDIKYNPDLTPYVLFRTFVADTGNMDYNFLVLIHAMIEQYLCYKHGITDEQVCEWDMKHTHCDDPGSHEEAPYHLEHSQAEEIEASLSVYLDVDWDKYSKQIDKTLAKYPKRKKVRNT